MAAESYTASIAVAAEPDAVFDYFTRADAIVRWMGDYAVLDAHPGGQFTVDINGVPVRGAYLELDRPPPRRTPAGATPAPTACRPARAPS